MCLTYKFFIVFFLLFLIFSNYALSQSSAEMYYSLGQKYMNQGNFGLAVLSFKKAIELSPDWAEAYNSLGMAYYQLFEFDDAIKQFDKAIELNPYYTEAKINKNRALRSIERYKPVKDGFKLWHRFVIVGGVLAIGVVSVILIKN
ncbi:MAG: tetratricopeptide repeat protein [Candidatus Poribacteria bacterium]